MGVGGKKPEEKHRRERERKKKKNREKQRKADRQRWREICLRRNWSLYPDARYIK